MKLALLFLICATCWAQTDDKDLPRIDVNGRTVLREVVGAPVVFVEEDGQRWKHTPIRRYGNWSEDGSCVFEGKGGGIFMMRNGVSAPEMCYQDAEMWEDVTPVDKQELYGLKLRIEWSERYSQQLKATVEKLLQERGCKGDEIFSTNPDFQKHYDTPHYYCHDGKWDATVAATSGCVLTQSVLDKINAGDEKLEKWWSKCR